MPLPIVEIVSHCYSIEHPHYAAFLRYQLASLMSHHWKECQPMATVCWCPRDWATEAVIAEFEDIMPLKLYPMDLSDLGRRCIGRNMAALKSDATIVWFADVDQVYRDGVLDRLATMKWPDGASMVFPQDIQISKDHETGDTYAARAMLGQEWYPKRPWRNDDFIPKHYNRAIGGVQIVQGDFARKHGYLNGHRKWQTPRTDGKPFKDFVDDRAYRGVCVKHGPIVPIDLPGMYRLRHSTTTH